MFVEFAKSPAAIGTRTPRFSWQVPDRGRGTRQGAYRVLVSSSRNRIENADLWDSGRVESSKSTNVAYGGLPLESNRDYFWTVRIWDADGAEISTGSIEWFATGLYKASDWTGTWIGMGDPEEPVADAASFQQDRVAPEVDAVEPEAQAPLLRQSFGIQKPVRRARVFVCGLGLFELRINGKKVGDDVLSTPRTDFRVRALYSTYDITDLLCTGENAIGLILGNGWFNGMKKYWGWQMQWYGSPRALVEMIVEFQDGGEARIVSDESWRGEWSPITFNCIYDGEDYDARLEHDGWDTPEFDDHDWRSVSVVPGPGGVLAPATNDPEQITETVSAVGVTEPIRGTYVFDLGVNMTGWVRLRIRGGEAGTRVVLRYAEAVHDDGSLDPASNGNARQEDSYVKRSSDEEEYEPRFTFHGFRYVEITGYPSSPSLDCISGRFARVAVAESGRFECSDPLVTKIHRATLQSQRCNIQMGVPTDDTQRPERLGWGADAWGTATEALYNLWMPRVYDKWIGDFRDQQDELGMVGMITPQAGAEEDLVWSSAFLLIPWWQYLHYGDTRILTDSYDSWQRYMAFLEKCGTNEVGTQDAEGVIDSILWRCGKDNRFPSAEKKGFLQIGQWGDHLATAEGSASRANLPLSMATAFYYLDLVTMASIAEVLERRDDAEGYRKQAERVKDAFNDRFLDTNVGYYDTGVQSAQAWPLVFGLVPEEHRDRVASYFIHSIERRQRRLTTGYVGTKFAIQALSELGRDDLVWRLATSTEFPSWGYMLRKDRTTSCENWDGDTGSLNHAPLGAAIDEWFYWGLAGIRTDQSAPGFEHTVFRPFIPTGLSWVRASVETIRGSVALEWRQSETAVAVDVSVPANSTASLRLPAVPAAITEGGVPIESAEGTSVQQATDAETLLSLVSGDYQFSYAQQSVE